jgi:mono/diheme cytochrome c family protein
MNAGQCAGDDHAAIAPAHKSDVLQVLHLDVSDHIFDMGVIQAVISYIRSQSAAGEMTPEPPDHLNPLGLIMLGAGLLPGGKPVQDGVIKAPPKSPGAEYGEYILSYQDCRECHGANLMGGVQGQLAPIGPGLTLVKDWKLEEFISTMRTGTDPAGHELGKQMPWQPIGKMDDAELTAIYEYLIHLPGS